MEILGCSWLYMCYVFTISDTEVACTTLFLTALLSFYEAPTRYSLEETTMYVEVTSYLVVGRKDIKKWGAIIKYCSTVFKKKSIAITNRNVIKIPLRPKKMLSLECRTKVKLLCIKENCMMKTKIPKRDQSLHVN